MKQEYPNRDAREKLVPGSLNFVALARRGVNCVGGLRIEVAVWCEMVRQPSYTSALPVGPGPGQMR